MTFPSHQPSEPSTIAPTPVPPPEPVTRYFLFTARAVKVMLGSLVLLLGLQGVATFLHWPDRAAAGLFAVQMLILGVLLAPNLPIWQRRPGATLGLERAPEPDTPSFRDGF